MRHCERSEAPIKRPLSRGKKSPQLEFLILFRSANYDELNPGRTLPLPMPKFLLGRCQRPSRDFAAPSTHQDLGQGMGIFPSFCHACDFGTRGLSRTKITGYPDPFRLPTDQKIFGSKPCPRALNNLVVIPASNGSRPGQQRYRSPYVGGEWGPNQSPGFTSFVSGSPSRPSQLSKGSSGYPNIFS
jgi:hypothetical protein